MEKSSAALTSRLADLTRRYNFLEHSFYQRWSAGTLTRDELNDYAGQYSHVAAALPRCLDGAAAAMPAHADELSRHAAEEEPHVALWERFALALDPGRAGCFDTPNQSTAALLSTCGQLSAAGAGAAVAWAIEAQSPEVSAAKLDGLVRHYDMTPAGGARYFDIHRERDVEHRAELEVALADLDQAAAVAAAEATLAGIWDLLTSVERRPAATA